MAKITVHGGSTDSAATVSYPVGVLPGAGEVPPPPRPPNKAPKAVWVAYAEALGEDSSGSKPTIVARVG